MLTNNAMYIIFVGVMLFDILTGFVKAIFWKQWNSDTGIKGISKHMLIFLLITSVYLINTILNTTDFSTEVEYIIHAFTFYYIYCYINSIFENFGVMGIPYPKYLKVKVEGEIKKLNEKGGKNE